MITILKYTQLIVAILLMMSILMQSKGTGLELATMANASPIQTKKRGAEKVLYNATIVLAILFVVVSISFIFA